MENNKITNYLVLPIDNFINIDPNLIIENQKDFINDFICIICHNMVMHPKMCKNCERIFCKKCIQKTIESTQRCPYRCDYVESNLPRPIMNHLNNLKFKCIYQECDNNISYEKFVSHLKNECIYVLKKAKCLGCKFIYPLKEIENHLSNCKKIKVLCNHCENLIQKRDKEEHEIYCEEKLVDCRECKMTFKRINLRNHTKKECDMNKSKIKNLDDIEFNEDSNIIQEQQIKLKFEKYKHIKFNNIRCAIQLFTNNNIIMLAIGESNDIIIYNIQDKTDFKLRGHTGDIQCLYQTDNNSILFSGSSDMSIKVWELSSLSCIKTLLIQAEITNILQSDNYLICSDSDKKISVWNIDEYKLLFKLHGHHGLISSIIKLALNKDKIASCSYDKTIKLWSLSQKRIVATLYEHEAEIESILSYNNAKYKDLLLSAGYDQQIIIWDIKGYQCIYKIHSGNSINSMISLGVNGLIITGGISNYTIWSMNNNSLSEIQTTNENKISEIIKIETLEDNLLFAIVNINSIQIYENK